MEPLEFTAEVIKSLACPLALVIAVILLRTEVANWQALDFLHA